MPCPRLQARGSPGVPRPSPHPAGRPPRPRARRWRPGRCRAATFTDDLATLARIPAPSGREQQLRDAINHALSPGCATLERAPLNLSVTCGAERPALVVVAALDEESWLVSGLTDDGYLRL